MRRHFSGIGCGPCGQARNLHPGLRPGYTMVALRGARWTGWPDCQFPEVRPGVDGGTHREHPPANAASGAPGSGRTDRKVRARLSATGLASLLQGVNESMRLPTLRSLTFVRDASPREGEEE